MLLVLLLVFFLVFQFFSKRLHMGTRHCIALETVLLELADICFVGYCSEHISGVDPIKKSFSMQARISKDLIVHLCPLDHGTCTLTAVH